ncbi:glucose-6-phosphate isomerase [Nonomuraea longispora]|uniref:Glucose-6-phosphate isomerase n=1 Tax=Nonomuraea longispora TaxID=1848320 RepID=A0A4R4NE21_9ACTN|nr:glucose-6-phosphate isomerase [Nonomuraea longispora]TDC06604.1 glucose-6-phosphate isomerase [Nonomuraea longispora]
MKVSCREEGVASAAASAAGRLVADGVPARLAAGDPTLWGEDAEAGTPAGPGRRGDPQAPYRGSRELLPELGRLAERARAQGLTHVVLAGAGGSPAAAEVICDTDDVPLTVLDTTDPGQVLRALAEPPDATIVVVADAAGSALETDALLRVYERYFTQAGIAPAERIVVVTGPGSPLEARARESGLQVLLSAPGSGGRVPALSAYTLVACALAGARVERLLDDAGQALPLLSLDTGNPGLDLGAALGGAALGGRDKLLLEDQLSAITGLPGWIEELIAGSTGKRGRGILPVVGADPHRSGDELVVAIESDVGDVRVDGPLGAQFPVWEYAAAVAALLLEVDPFDRPDEAGARDETDALLALPDLPAGAPAFTDGPVEVYGGVTAKDLPGLFAELLHTVPAGGHLSIMAYLDRLAAFDAPVPDGAGFEQLTDAWMMADAATLRALLALRTDRPVTFGWGPRCLHTTGQLHKGGPQNGVFLLITGAAAEDVEVPGRPYTLGRLQLAQALADLGAVETRGRPAVRLHVTDRAAGVARLLAAAQEV